MGPLGILLQVLQAANLSTPLIAALIGKVQSGVDAGKTEEQIIAEALALAKETDTITTEDENPNNV